MISPTELQAIPIFACLEEADRQRFAARAADVRLQPGEWLIREGEMPSFFVLLEGTVLVVKDILGRTQDVAEYKVGDFFGEVPILLGAPSFAGVKAKENEKARLARFDRAAAVRDDSGVSGVQCADLADDDGSADEGAAVCDRGAELAGAADRDAI